jgi:FAD/FMN-containing dehydrogenase
VVVPELKSITIGGAVAGGGIESSSFRYGLVHETIQEMEVLLSDGRTILCTPDGPYRDLFFGFPNSYGTLGYVLRVKVKLKRVKKYVRLTHTLYSDATRYMEDLKNICEQQRSKEEPVSFIDGTIFGPNELYLTLGTFVDEVPFTSNYKYMGIYYKSIQKKKTDYLTTPDYIWRWDPDWFWCSKCFFVQNPLVRLLFGKFCLKSTVYWKIRDFELKHRILEKIERFCGSKKRSEEVIQDVQIPIEHCVSFLDFFHKEIGIKPIWVCPTSASDKKDRYDLYLMDPSKLYINFGFWAVVNTPEKKEEGYFNKKVEQKVKELNGKKSLYSTSFYSYKEFWELYNKGAYDTLKVKYDPSNALGDLCEKSVKGR